MNQDLPKPTKLLLGISGGIAAYKTPDLVRRLKERNFDVRVVITDAAKSFVAPLALQAVCGYPVHDELFDPTAEAAMGHIELAKWADVILIAPATANTLAKLAHGMADDLMSTVILASKAPLVVAPAMNQQMWANPQVQANIELLRFSEVHIIEPDSGEQACGDVGEGRMPEPLAIADKMQSEFANESRELDRTHITQELTGKNILITAGPTREALDPVRYLSNHSSGKMGYAIAEAAAAFGANVTLVSGPVNLAKLTNVNVISVSSAAQMLKQVQSNINNCDIFIGCAAVADYSPLAVAEQKIKKQDEIVQLELSKNPDILAWVADQPNRPFVVGFAAESQHLEANAKSKLERKNLDMICANNISSNVSGFNSDFNEILVLHKGGQSANWQRASKRMLANYLMNEIVNASNGMVTDLNNAERSAMNERD